MGRKLLLLAALAGAALLPAAPSRADGLASQYASFPWRARGIRYNKHLVAHPGEAIRVSSFYALAADCSQNGWPQMQVRFQPEAGQLSDAHGLGYPGYPARNIRHRCNDSLHPGDIVFYRAPDGFRGTDHFTLDMIFPNSRAAYQSVTVDVR